MRGRETTAVLSAAAAPRMRKRPESRLRHFALAHGLASRRNRTLNRPLNGLQFNARDTRVSGPCGGDEASSARLRWRAARPKRVANRGSTTTKTANCAPSAVRRPARAPRKAKRGARARSLARSSIGASRWRSGARSPAAASPSITPRNCRRSTSSPCPSARPISPSSTSNGELLANRGDTGGAAVRLADLPPYLPEGLHRHRGSPLLFALGRRSDRHRPRHRRATSPGAAACRAARR